MDEVANSFIPSDEELGQLRLLAGRLSDLNPELVVNGFEATVVMKFDDCSKVSASILDEHFGFGAEFTFDADGRGFAESWGYEPMGNLGEAEAEVRRTWAEMPGLKEEALQHQETD